MLPASRRGAWQLRIINPGMCEWTSDQPSAQVARWYGTSTTRIVKVTPKPILKHGSKKVILQASQRVDTADAVVEQGSPTMTVGLSKNFTKVQPEQFLNRSGFDETETKSLARFPLTRDPEFRKEDWKLITPEVGKKKRRYPSVTHILKETMPLNNFLMLLRWKQRMIEELGEEGFVKFNDQMLKEGSDLHRYIQMYLTGTPLEDIHVDEANEGHWKSLSHVLPHITDVRAVEKYIKHPFLQYAGYLDCLAVYKGKLCVIDWKTSKKPKPTLAKCFDSPLQTAAYTGAVNFCNELDIEVAYSLLVIAYKNGQKADTHFMPAKLTQFYWQKWLKRLNAFQELKLKEEEAMSESTSDDED